MAASIRGISAVEGLQLNNNSQSTSLLTLLTQKFSISNREYMSFKHMIGIVSVTFFLASCGGGTSSSSDTVPAPNVGATAPAPAPAPVVDPAPVAPAAEAAPLPEASDATNPIAIPVPPTAGSRGSSPISPAPLLTDPVAPVRGLETSESNFFFFSYDDSSSTAARDLTIHAIENGSFIDPSWGRAHEFLNAEEFNKYGTEELELLEPLEVSMGFSQFNAIEIATTEALGPFQVSIGLSEFDLAEISGDQPDPLHYALGVGVFGPILAASERPNVVLTLLVDTSGSMRTPYANETRSDIQSLLEVTQHGLRALQDTLKDGDIINLVTFSSKAYLVLENADYDSQKYLDAVDGLTAGGSTNLDAGITLAYQVANRYYDASKSNRVIMLTDAFANRGEVDSSVIAESTTISALEGILFAGVGIGNNFNDLFLNELTDIGKGVYSAMITPEDAERIFTTGFTRFIDHAVEDIRFKLAFPDAVSHVSSAAEQISTVASEVQTINFAFNDSQYFLEVFSAEQLLEPAATFILEISYQDEDGETVVSSTEKQVRDILGSDPDQILGALMVTTLANLVSGTVQCTDVVASGLFNAGNTSEIYTKYHALISTHCNASDNREFIPLPG